MLGQQCLDSVLQLIKQCNVAKMVVGLLQASRSLEVCTSESIALRLSVSHESSAAALGGRTATITTMAHP